MFRFFVIFFLFVNGLFLSKIAVSQVSQGGVPLEIPEFKSAGNYTVILPPFRYDNLKNAKIEDEDTRLKPFRFAFPFEGNYSTRNSGAWFSADNGMACWRLKIISTGAKSLNLIFSDFAIPKGARLFVYNEHRILGAFTDYNNKKSGKFAIAPIQGDELTIQFEVPESLKNNDYFTLSTINHDYVGILKSDRRPLGKEAGSCNVNVNCEVAEDWNDAKNAVCRMIVNGVEVCTGVLVNNTAEDQKPYILSAAHCYDKWEYAQTTVYVFNYESPFCASLDGDPLNSISGATMKAQFDSLDFALTELSLVPPPEYRPFFAGWNHSGELPSSTVSIHHPQGDIKKISFDYNAPVVARFSNGYTKDGFLKILRWDNGVTEAGSSGGPLFNPNQEIIGTLTGGEAECGNPINDYFERFDMSWDHRSDSTKQLKYWLDPLKNGAASLSGKLFNADENLCGSFTHLTDIDTYGKISVINSGTFSGYWGGSNSVGITEFMERFSIPGNEQLSGVSMGVGKVNAAGINNQSKIKLKVYNGNSKPQELIYSQEIRIKELVPDAMNFLEFNDIVEPADTFFVGFELSNVQSPDSFVVYQSLRASYEKNAFYLKQNNSWLKFNDANPNGKSMVNVFELVACNIDNLTDSPEVNIPLEIMIYPNPTSSAFIVESGKEIDETSVGVFNLIGQAVNVKVTPITLNKMEINLMGNIPGVYLVRLKSDNRLITRKISFVPW